MQQNPWTPPPPPTAAPANIPNFLVPSILATIFCCLPAGVVAIIYAAQVNGKVASGDIQGALASSKNAKTWTFVSVGVGLVVTLIVIALNVLGTFASM